MEWRRLAAALIMLATLLGSSPVAAQGADGSNVETRELAERYAPVVMIAPQDGPCDSDGEAFAPMSVDLILDNPDVILRQAGLGDPVVERAPSAASLFGRGEGFYLDFPGLSLEPGCVYESDFRADSEGQPSVVYAHIATQDDAPDQLAVQYWLYWYYNDWNNKHESDWEFIQVLFDASTVSEALREDPVSVGYAQHEGGERSSWTDGQLLRDGTRPIVFPSTGSHGSYFEPAAFLGRNGTQGFGCDTTTENTRELRPEVEVLPTEVSAATDDYAWLGFTGRWGERGNGPFNGPTGPNTKPQWENPIDWHNDLRASSVIIPGGDETNVAVLSTFCNVVDFGANQLRAFQVSPTRLLVSAAVAFIALRLLVQQTEWSVSSPTPLRQRRRVGQMLRTSLGSYLTSGKILLAVAGGYLVLAGILALVGWLSAFTVAQTVSGLLTATMGGIVVATFSAYWHLESADEPSTLTHTLELVWRRLPSIFGTVLLATVIVGGLAVTVIGIPFAIRQLVRYQFAVPIVTTEGLSGMAALRRSSELTDGRWWHTALPLALLAAAALFVNSTLQLGLLIVLVGAPLWLYVAAAFLVAGLVLPAITTAPVLLYGDAVAFDEARTGE